MWKLRKAPKRELYWVVTIATGKKHSKEPITLEKAKAQLRILESTGGGKYTDMLTDWYTKFIEGRNLTERQKDEAKNIFERAKSRLKRIAGTKGWETEEQYRSKLKSMGKDNREINDEITSWKRDVASKAKIVADFKNDLLIWRNSLPKIAETTEEEDTNIEMDTIETGKSYYKLNDNGFHPKI